MSYARNLAVFGVSLLLLMTINAGGASAQSDDCTLFQGEIAVLEMRASTLFVQLSSARTELAAIDGRLGVSTFDLLDGSVTIDAYNAAYHPVTADLLHQATTQMMIITKTYEDLQLVEGTLALLRNASAEVCAETNGSGGAAASSGGDASDVSTRFGECVDGMMVLDNTVGAGGDEIILAPCDVASGEPAGGTSATLGECLDGVMVLENTVDAGGDEIILAPCGTATSDGNANGVAGVLAGVPIPPDDPFDGWRFFVPGVLHYSELPDGEPEEQATSISFYLSDEGILYDATLFFYSSCEEYGTITDTGADTYDLDFSGNYDGTSAYWSTEANFTLLATTLDENGRIPVALTASSALFFPDTPPHLTGEFVQSTVETGYLERYDVENYSQVQCGVGPS